MNLNQIAEKRANAKLGFYIHATVFVLVNATQFLTHPFSFLIAYPFWGWALGLFIHGLVIGFSSSGLHQQMIEDELEHLYTSRPQPSVTISPPLDTEKGC